MNHIGANDKLKDAVSDGGNDAHFGTVPISDKTDDQHGEEGDGTAVGQARQLNDGGDDGGQRQGHA